MSSEHLIHYHFVENSANPPTLHSRYAVPLELAIWAKDYRDGLPVQVWNDFTMIQRDIMQEARMQLQKRFPRMPAYVEHRVALSAVRKNWKYFEKDELDAMVVQHVSKLMG